MESAIMAILSSKATFSNVYSDDQITTTSLCDSRF